MQTKKYSLALALVLLLGPGLGASFGFTGANIRALRLGKDKGVSQEADSFEPEETIYAAARVSDVAGTVNVKGRLVVEDVPGQQAGPIPGLEASVSLGGDGQADFKFSAPNKGWPKGKYILEVGVFTEGGEEMDRKQAEFAVD
jgi:hypothetical protein